MRFVSWTQWDSGRGGHAQLSEREQARLLSCLIGQTGDSTSTEVGCGGRLCKFIVAMTFLEMRAKEPVS